MEEEESFAYPRGGRGGGRGDHKRRAYISERARRTILWEQGEEAKGRTARSCEKRAEGCGAGDKAESEVAAEGGATREVEEMKRPANFKLRI